jgi:type 1 glutamine amidotransferase
VRRHLTITLSAIAASLIAPAARAVDFRILVFTKTEGFRHDSIPTGIAAIQALAAANDFSVDATEDGAAFTIANLQQYAAVVWLCATGDVLDGAQQAAFEQYIQAGGGYVGVHAAADCEYDWPWYGQLLGNGAWFYSHPAPQTAILNVADPDDLSTAHYPPSFSFSDEWYNFQANPRSAVHVLLTIDESTYDAGFGAMGVDHPISWRHEFDGGRAWYTAMGHPDETYLDAGFRQHLLGGIRWAAGWRPSADANCDGSVDFFDIDPFLLALFDAAGYALQYPDCGLSSADVNWDGRVDFFDIDPFLGCLFGGCP